MTNQEKLAELIGEEGFCGAYITWHYSGKHIPGRLKPKPPDELIEIVEVRWVSENPKWNAVKYERMKTRSCCWYVSYCKMPARASGKTIQEARMSCAIAGMKRLKEEGGSNK